MNYGHEALEKGERPLREENIGMEPGEGYLKVAMISLQGEGTSVIGLCLVLHFACSIGLAKIPFNPKWIQSCIRVNCALSDVSLTPIQLQN